MKKSKLSIIFILTIIAISTMAQKQTTPKSNLEQLIEKIEQKYAPDKRVEVFAIREVKSENGSVLLGETTSHEAYEELIAATKKLNLQIKDSIRLLPDKALGDKNWGVINNSVADVRLRPAYGSEMVSQVLLGMPVRILEKTRSWQRIQTPEGYIGWMSGSLEKQTREELNEYLTKPKIIIVNQYGLSYSEHYKQSLPVSDIVVGDMLAVMDIKENFYHVNYPDGREAFINIEDAMEVDRWLSKIDLTGKSIVETAMQLKGIPYVWGGTSSKGMDCSGYTKLVYWLHGIIIARDASQQAKNGIEIDTIGNFDNAQKGDLVFFGEKPTATNPQERVVHVGIYIGNKQFIHASDYIHISGFDPEDPLYDKFNTNRYLRTMRLIGKEGTKGIEHLKTHPFYQQH